MEKVNGKYYWVRTEQGKEIAHQRYSGQWELCGISAGENVNDAILEVIGEVANDVSDTIELCALGGVSGNEVAVCPNCKSDDIAMSMKYKKAHCWACMYVWQTDR